MPAAHEHSAADDQSAADDHAFGAEWWEQHYRDQHPVDRAPGHHGPSPYVVTTAQDLAPGSALDAGCGRGTDALYLAQRGWQVTAVDVAPTAVREAERAAAGQDADAASRIGWLAADLMTLEPPQAYDLVISQYVHPAVPFPDFVSRLAGWVAPGGTLLVVGHDSTDAHSSEHAPADASIDLAGVRDALDGERWNLIEAAPRSREVEHGAGMHLADLVVRARRRAAAR